MDLSEGLISDDTGGGSSSLFVFAFFGIYIIVILSLYLYDAHLLKKCEHLEHHPFCSTYTCPDGVHPPGCYHKEDIHDVSAGSS